MPWSIIVLSYFLLGSSIILLTRARVEVFKFANEVNTSHAPMWKVLIFRTVVFSACLILWPLFLKGWLARPKTLLDDLENTPKLNQERQVYDAMGAICEEGCDSDELPNGYGDFGYAPTNPIPTRTVYGSISYLSRLRAPDGSGITYERVGSIDVAEVSPYPVDEYKICLPGGKVIATLYFSPYQKRNSEKVPYLLIGV